MNEELKHLEYTLAKYDEVILDSNLKKNNLKELYKHDYEALLEEKLRLESEIKSIEKAKLNPYFARIDFESKTNKDICYIGKKGVIDFDNEIVTVDWRAPISSLYYDSNVGFTKYEAPQGIIEGNLLLKRQYAIENSKLINYNDVDTVSNDELLKPYLSVSADNRLKNIVASIQSEQNKIIREKINKNLVIQGVAGSGKTTVALHRIAYLVYNNKEVYKPSNYMVIGPNKFFISYISSVLPDLDVTGVCQNTLEELFENYVDEGFKVINSLDKIVEVDLMSSFKVSLKLKDIIDDYFNNLEIIPKEDFKIKGIKILSRNLILNIYNEINKSIYKSVKSKIERVILLLNKYVNENSDTIISNLIKNNIDKKIIDEVKNNLNINLKKYFNILNIKAKDIYIEILNSLDYDVNEIRKGIVKVEDIPSLMYIKYKLNGSSEFDIYKHIVIDEAQDYGEFTFYVIKTLFNNSTFSIYGDLAQSLYSYRSVSNWECLENIFDKLEIIKLSKSYRTTVEIMNEANKINELLKLDKAIPVIRHGSEVKYYESLQIKDIINSEFKTIALITKDDVSTSKLYNKLKDEINLNLITSDNLNYGSNISILPSYLSKGLEFDVVVIVDDFNRNSVMDLKLLYVSMTRALHKLYIVNDILSY